ncbi:MAG: hypothetical protein Q8K45_13265 [Rubrivivax sp.]|nr:hypothetical protein [Rubrivivax sp.]
MWRRGWLVAVPLMVFAATAPAQATLKSVGVFSMLGEHVDVSLSSDAPRDTRIENTERQSMDFKGIGFDLLALRAAIGALARDRPATKVTVFRSTAVMGTAEQRALVAGARNAELPAWMVKTIEENRLSHVLLITRARGTLDARTGEGHGLGRGTVEGIGFHIDTLYRMKNASTGAVSSGLLAPHAHIHLMLMDTMSAEIVASHDIRDSFAFASTEQQEKADPWAFMPNEEKVRTLRSMVEAGMARGMSELLRPR